MTTGSGLTDYDDAFHSNCGIDFADLMAPTPNTAAFFDALTKTPRPSVDYGVYNNDSGLAKIRSSSQRSGSTSLFAVPHSSSNVNYDTSRNGRSPLPGRSVESTSSAETTSSNIMHFTNAPSPSLHATALKRGHKRLKPIIESISPHSADHDENQDAMQSNESSSQQQQSLSRRQPQQRQLFSQQIHRSLLQQDDYQLQPIQADSSKVNSTFDSLNAAQQQEDAEQQNSNSHSSGDEQHSLDHEILPPNSGDSIVTTHCLDQSPRHSLNSHKQPNSNQQQYDSMSSYGNMINHRQSTVGQNGIYVLHPPLPPVGTAAAAATGANNSPLPSYSALTPLSVYSTAPLSVPSCQEPANNNNTHVKSNQQKSHGDSTQKPPTHSNRLACKISELADNLIRLVRRGSAEAQVAGEIACDLRMSIKALLTTAQILLDQMRHTGRNNNGAENNINNISSGSSRPTATPYSNAATINRQSSLNLMIDYLSVVKDVCKLYQHTPPEHVPEPAIVFVDMLLSCVLRSL